MAITYTIPIFYGKAYPEGPRASPAQPIFSNLPGTSVPSPVTHNELGSYDFTNSGMSGLQSVEIDNSTNSQVLIMVVADTGQQLTAPAYSILTAPLYTGQLAFQAQFFTVLIPQIGKIAPAIRFFNMPQDFATRPGFISATGAPAGLIVTIPGQTVEFEVQFKTGANVGTQVLPTLVFPQQYIVRAIEGSMRNVYNDPTLPESDFLMWLTSDGLNAAIFRTWQDYVGNSILNTRTSRIIAQETGLNIPIQALWINTEFASHLNTTGGQLEMTVTYDLVAI